MILQREVGQKFFAIYPEKVKFPMSRLEVRPTKSSLGGKKKGRSRSPYLTIKRKLRSRREIKIG